MIKESSRFQRCQQVIIWAKCDRYGKTPYILVDEPDPSHCHSQDSLTSLIGYFNELDHMVLTYCYISYDITSTAHPNYLCQNFEICVLLFHMKLHFTSSYPQNLNGRITCQILHNIMHPIFIYLYTPLTSLPHITCNHCSVYSPSSRMGLIKK